VYCCFATVDLVGEHEVGEDRSLLEAEPAFASLLDDDVGAYDVGRHQVRRELDPAEAKLEGIGHGAHQHGLAQPGDSLEQCVASSQQADERLAHELVLPDDVPPNLGLDAVRQLGEALRLDVWRGGGCGGRLLGHRSLAHCVGSRREK
jgi:hypothetical protein